MTPQDYARAYARLVGHLYSLTMQGAIAGLLVLAVVAGGRKR